MRIVGGRHRGRRLVTPGGRHLRPTPDRVREAVFNIVEHRFAEHPLADASVLDAFAGTGAMGLEALSRGARHATFIDDDDEARDCARRNAGALGEGRNVTLLGLDASRPPPPPLAAQAPCAPIFLDPPYGSGLAGPALAGLAARGWIAPGALCMVEVAAKEPLDAPPAFRVADQRRYGATRIVFLIFEGETAAPYGA